MNYQLLLPHNFRKIGWVILILGIAFTFYVIKMHFAPAWLNVPVLFLFNSHAPNGFANVITNNISDEIGGIMVATGGIFVGFSKEKFEDEGLAFLRLNALMWSVLIHAIILIFFQVFTFDMTFLKFMMYNLFTPLLLFIIRYQYLYWKTRPKK